MSAKNIAENRDFRIGIVSSIDYENGMVSCTFPQYDDATGAKIPYFSFLDEYKMPEVGSPILVLYFRSGQAAGINLGRYWNKVNHCPHMQKGVWRHELAPESKYDKCWMEYDDEKCKLTIRVPWELEIIVGDCMEHGPDESGKITIKAIGKKPTIEIKAEGDETGSVAVKAEGVENAAVDVKAEAVDVSNVNITSASLAAGITETTKTLTINAESTTNSGPCVHK